MSDLADVIDRYENRSIDAHHAAVEVILLLTPASEEVAVAAIPREVREAVCDILCAYVPGRMATNYGPLPTESQIAIARSLFSR
jgi:hypothetical protein